MRKICSIDVGERRARLSLRHRLVPSRRTDDVVAIADDLVALHSTDPVSVYLSAAARMAHPALSPMETALYEARSLLRHHAMRRTLWVFGQRVARLAHASTSLGLLGPEERRFARLIEGSGVTTDGIAWLDAARRDVLAALESSGPVTARELGDAVPALRVPIEMAVGKSYATTQAAHTRVLLLLGFEGLIVRARPTGSWINGQYRWATMASWVPGGFGGAGKDEAARELVDLWLRAFGPATTADVQWWTGWTLTVARRALAAAGAVEVDLDGTPGWVAADDADPVRSDEPWVALLPGLDPTTMGWKGRDWYLDPAFAGRLFDRNGNGGPTIWVDGRVVGGWVQRKDGTIAHELLADVGAASASAIEAAAHDLEALLGGTRFTARFPAPIQAELLR
ncbi:MAG: winged helix DNA-binding domain-containing protein [Acidimicrobiia bacterium]